MLPAVSVRVCVVFDPGATGGGAGAVITTGEIVTVAVSLAFAYAASPE